MLASGGNGGNTRDISPVRDDLQPAGVNPTGQQPIAHSVAQDDIHRGGP